MCKNAINIEQTAENIGMCALPVKYVYPERGKKDRQGKADMQTCGR